MPDKLNKTTVLMAVYNGERYIKQSVKSILNQTFKDFEFLIVDDGSFDSTGAIISEIKDSRIKYKKISHGGLASALNYGINLSRSDYIARIDSDDVCTPERLEKQISFLDSHPEIDVVAGWSVYFKDAGKIQFTVKPPASDKEIKKFLLLHNPINHSSVTFRKKKIADNGGYNDSFRCYEDFELWFRLRDKLTFHILPEFLVFTRLHTGSMTESESKIQIHGILEANAVQGLDNSETEKDKKFWKNILFWVEYFYGEKEKSRTYFTGDAAIKKSIAYLSTFFPPNAFKEIIEYRFRQRIQTGLKGRSELKSQLVKLLN